MEPDELLPILQAAVSPVILISGVGLLILSMTNRFGRVADRARLLGDALRSAPGEDAARRKAQLAILLQRARRLRTAISFAAFSVLIAAVLVMALFIAAFLRVHVVALGAVLFIICLLSLVASLVAFLQDISLSLAALQLELAPSSRD